MLLLDGHVVYRMKQHWLAEEGMPDEASICKPRRKACNKRVKTCSCVPIMGFFVFLKVVVDVVRKATSKQFVLNTE